MKCKILIGTVRHDTNTYQIGEVVELPDKEVEALVREGVVEKYVEPIVSLNQKDVSKPVTVPSTQPQEREKMKVEAVPSEDWTYKELEDYAKSIGMEIPEDWNKEKLWEALKVKRGGESK